MAQIDLHFGLLRSSSRNLEDSSYRLSPAASSTESDEGSDGKTPKYIIMDAGILMQKFVTHCPFCGKKGPLLEWNKVS